MVRVSDLGSCIYLTAKRFVYRRETPKQETVSTFYKFWDISKDSFIRCQVRQ